MRMPIKCDPLCGTSGSGRSGCHAIPLANKLPQNSIYQLVLKPINYTSKKYSAIIEVASAPRPGPRNYGSNSKGGLVHILATGEPVNEAGADTAVGASRWRSDPSSDHGDAFRGSVKWDRRSA